MNIVSLLLRLFLISIGGYLLYLLFLLKRDTVAEGFLGAFFAWALIILVDEIFFQQFIPGRSVQLKDIPYNLSGASIGLVLSNRWFWRK